MSLHGSAPPLRISLRPSRRLSIVLWLTHGGALLMLLPLAWPWWGLLPMAVMLMASLAWHLSRHALLRHPRAVAAVELSGDGQWSLFLRNGERLAVRLALDTYVHPQLVILNFHRGRGRRRAVVLCRDAVDQDSFRRLRVRLGGM